MGNLGNYGEARRDFQWNVPEDFNFGRDVVDRYAADPSKLAFYFEDAKGSEAKYTFRDVSRAANRSATSVSLCSW